MITLTPAYTAPSISPKNARIVGEHGKDLLVSVATTKGTSLELVSESGSSKTIILFSTPIDIVNADFSWDNELVHVTERIAKDSGFTFSSVICEIQSGAKSKAMRHDQIIEGKFLTEKKWQMLHFVGGKISHISIRVVGKKVEIEKLKGGVHISQALWWDSRLSQSNTLLVVCRGGGTFYNEFQFTSKGIFAPPPVAVQLPKESELPGELALLCDHQLSLPYMRSSPYRIFVAKHHKRVCLIQQVFRSEESWCSFTITVLPKYFIRNITVIGVQSDFPICFVEKRCLVFVFVPNQFMYMIDLSRDVPNIFELPRKFALMSSNVVSTSIRNSNVLVDLVSREIYTMDVSLAHILPIVHKEVDQKCWIAMAHVCSGIKDPELLVAVFEFCQSRGLVAEFQKFLMEFMELSSLPEPKGRGKIGRTVGRSLSVGSYGYDDPWKFGTPKEKKELRRLPDWVKVSMEELEMEFPSAGTITRTEALKNYMKHEKRDTHGYERILRKLKKQNKMALLVRDALDIWRDKCKPMDTWRLMILFMIQNESAFSNFPNIPFLKDELRALASALCSRQFETELAEYGIVGANAFMETSQGDADYWRHRFSNIVTETGSYSCSSSQWIPTIHDGKTSTDSSEGTECESGATPHHYHQSVYLKSDRETLPRQLLVHS